VMVNRFNPGGRGLQNLAELLPTPKQVDAALRVANEAVESFGLPIAVSVPIPPCLVDMSPYERLSSGFCAAGTNRAYYTFDPLGNLRMCNHSPTILGNLRATNFRTLIRSALARHFNEGVAPECANCNIVSECRGNCKAAAEQAYGHICVLEPFVATYITQRSLPRSSR
ncbi:MAG: SPASM domain-containing protein, partial [Candidatus Zipacnadales bacterium]